MKSPSIISIILFLILVTGCANFQYSTVYNGSSQEGKHARGVDVNNSKVIITGYQGAVTILDMASNNFKVKDSIIGAEDLRDVHLFDDYSYITISSGERGLVYHHKSGITESIFNMNNLFLDGIDFWENGKDGIIYGDEFKGKIFIMKTTNGGQSWYGIDTVNIPNSLKNEAGFAASGTGITLVEDSIAYLVTGAADIARVYKSTDKGEHWKALNTPMRSGDSYGIYTTSFWSANDGIIAGGSWTDSLYNEKIAFITHDGGKNWENISAGLPGYISCISSTANGDFIIVTGRMGAYYSLNQGKTWKLFSSHPFYTVHISEDIIVFSGKNGVLKIYKYEL